MDWKNTLSNLRDSLNEDYPDSGEEILIEEKKESDQSSQKTPLLILTDKKGRKGKIATIIEGFTIPQNEVEDIARKLKQKLGTGGSVREGEILIQGDYKEKVKKILEELSFKTRTN